MDEAKFGWSLNPALKWMKFVGLDLEGDRRSLISWLTLFLGLFHNFFCQFWSFIGHVYPLVKNSNANSTRIWVFLAEFGALALHGCGIHLVAAFLLRKKWSRFYSTLKQLDGHFDVKFHQGLRRSCIMGVIISILAVLNPVGAILSDINWSRFNLNAAFNVTFATTITYRVSTTMLYVIVTKTISSIFHQLGSELVDGRFIRIKDWKRAHVLACSCADQISSCFGHVLLLDVISIFLNVIIAAFSAFLSFTKSGHVGWGRFYLLYTLQLFIHLWLIGYVAVQLRKNAFSLVKKLRRVPGDKIVDLMNEVYHSVPQISAAGFFTINLKLIPMLIGTTTTYLVILYQFYSSQL